MLIQDTRPFLSELLLMQWNYPALSEPVTADACTKLTYVFLYLSWYKRLVCAVITVAQKALFLIKSNCFVDICNLEAWCKLYLIKTYHCEVFFSSANKFECQAT